MSLFRRPRGTGLLFRESDPRNDNYRIADRLTMAAAAPTSREWTLGPILDQGRGNTCVGHSITTELIAAPYRELRATSSAVRHEYALNHYRRTKVVGGQADPYDLTTGTFTTSGLQVAKDRGLITAYLWAATLEEVRDAVLTTGPVVMGTAWLDSMGKVPADGRVRVKGNLGPGATFYGHAYAITGYHPAKRFRRNKRRPWSEPYRAFRITNTWGTSWGQGGSAWIAWEALERLIEPQLRVGAREIAALPVTRGPVDLAALLKAHPDPFVS